MRRDPAGIAGRPTAHDEREKRKGHHGTQDVI
jgi:hypothetical protein